MRGGNRTGFWVLAAAFLAYAGLFIFRTSFIVRGERYFSLFDDAMVSMRYARNVAEGYGLVWNPGGERVEGFTNPLWVFYMSVIHRLPLPASKMSLPIQVTAAVLLVVNLYFVMRIARTICDGARSAAFGALALTASYLPLNNWSLQGTELGALVLLTTAAVSSAVEMLSGNAFTPVVYFLMGLGTWVRPDAAVAYVVVWCVLLFYDRGRRRQHALWGAAVLVGVMSVQTLARLLYYGDPLPNTFYLKMTGVPLAIRIARGGYMLLQFLWRSNPLLFAVAAFAARARDPRVRLLGFVVAGQCAYSVFVGGDAWEYWGGSNRFICVSMPLLFILLSIGLRRIVLAFELPPALPSRLAFAGALLLAIVSLNISRGPSALAELLLIRAPLHAGEGGENQGDVAEALWLRDVTTPSASIAVMRAGTIPYFTNRFSVDMLGKSDRRIAREPARISGTVRGFLEFRPGHVKFDFAYSIGEIRPDVVSQLRNRLESAARFLAGRYREICAPDGCVYADAASPNIDWTRLNTAPE